MLIKNYGLFWHADEIDWRPGKGRRFRLLGRRGRNRPSIRLTDFRCQQGIYILYSDVGPYYVGLAREGKLGNRLKDHRTDKHTGKWDRFSWFGFCSVLKSRDDSGYCRLKDIPDVAVGDPKKVITDVEALLIRAMGLKNINKTNFSAATEWTQVKSREIDHYTGKVG